MQTVILLGLVSLLTYISSETFYPLLSLYLTTTLGAMSAIVGVIESFAESLASLMKVYSGYFSDKMQKRKPLTIGLRGGNCRKAFLVSVRFVGMGTGREHDEPDRQASTSGCCLQFAVYIAD